MVGFQSHWSRLTNYILEQSNIVQKKLWWFSLFWLISFCFRTSWGRMPNPTTNLPIGQECVGHQAFSFNHKGMSTALPRERWLHPRHPLWKGGVWVGEHLRPLLILLLHQPLHRLHQRGHHQALPSLQQSCGRGQDRGQQPARVLAKGGGDGYSYGFPGVVVVAVN